MSPGTAPARRQFFQELVLEQMGCPYIWGGKGELREDIDGNYIRTFDCSGLVTFCLQKAGGPDWRATHAASDLWKQLLHTDDPLPATSPSTARTSSPSLQRTSWSTLVRSAQSSGRMAATPTASPSRLPASATRG